MKAKITFKQLKELHPLINFGYCEIQYLLKYENPVYYTANMYGRRADIYLLEYGKRIIYICTWYDTKGDINEIPYKITQEYEQKAKAIIQKEITRETKKTLLKAQLFKMIKENCERLKPYFS